MYRLFVALDLPENVKDELVSFCFGIPGVRWTPPDQLHLTLHFVGEVDGAVYEDVAGTLDDCADALRRSGSMDEFTLRLSGFGVFPPRRTPKVLWVGVEKNDQLAMLQKRVGSALSRAGIVLERRKFSPHITLARLRNSPREKIARFLAGHNLYKSEKVQLKEFKLYSSVLTPKGAIHTVEQRFKIRK